MCVRPFLVPKLAALAMLVLLASPGGAWAACRRADDIPSPASAARAARAIHCLVNEARTARGLGSLLADRGLRRAGRAHAIDMIRSRYFSHTSRDGRGPAARAAAWGLGRSGLRWIGENLAWASGPYATPRAVVAHWLGSPPHRGTMLDIRFRALGVAAVAGSPRAAQAPAFTFAAEFGG